MSNLFASLKKHAPAVLAVLGSVYAVLVQQGFVDPSNKFVVLVEALVGTVSLTILHLRQQANTAAPNTPVVAQPQVVAPTLQTAPTLPPAPAV